MSKNSERKKILFVSSFTPPLNAGGGKNAFNFASFLSEKEYQVTLLSLNRRGRLPRRESVKQLRIVRLFYFNHNLITKILSLFIILPGYLYYVAKNELVLIYGGNIIGFEFIILFSKILGKKIIFRSTMLGEDDAKSLILRRPLGKIRKWILSKTDVYFSLNHSFTTKWRETFGETNYVFESIQGVNTQVFHPVNKQERSKIRNLHGIPNNEIVLVSVGYLIERKGFRELFEYLSAIKLNFRLIIIGDHKVLADHYMYQYNAEMQSLLLFGTKKLKNKIVFLGEQEKVYEFLQVADILILNSKKEGFPNSILEAMACGVAVCIRKFEGLEERIIKHKENSIVYKNEEALLKGLNNLIIDAELRNRIGKSAARLISEEYSFDQILNKLVQESVL